MVHIYTAISGNAEFDKLVKEYRYYLPLTFIEKAKQFRFNSDRCRYLLGKILLARGMELLGQNNLTLEQLQWTAYHKPCFPSGLHFNISHSGNYVVCVLSNSHKVGIDIEEIVKVNFEEFTNCFTAGEWQHIKAAPVPQQAFFCYWTKKEAVIKADGRGMHIPLLSFEVNNDNITIGLDNWFAKEIKLAEGYAAHLVTNKSMQEHYSIQPIIY